MWDYIIKKDFRKMASEGGEWIHLTQDMIR
jgi:hypothetical protein